MEITWEKKGFLWWTRVLVYADGMLIRTIDPRRMSRLINVCPSSDPAVFIDKVIRVAARMLLHKGYLVQEVQSRMKAMIDDTERFLYGVLIYPEDWGPVLLVAEWKSYQNANTHHYSALTVAPSMRYLEEWLAPSAPMYKAKQVGYEPISVDTFFKNLIAKICEQEAL